MPLCLLLLGKPGKAACDWQSGKKTLTHAHIPSPYSSAATGFFFFFAGFLLRFFAGAAGG